MHERLLPRLIGMRWRALDSVLCEKDLHAGNKFKLWGCQLRQWVQNMQRMRERIRGVHSEIGGPDQQIPIYSSPVCKPNPF